MGYVSSTLAILRQYGRGGGATLYGMELLPEAERDITWIVAEPTSSRPALVAARWISHRPHHDGADSPLIELKDGYWRAGGGKWQVKVSVRILGS